MEMLSGLDSGLYYIKEVQRKMGFKVPKDSVQYHLSLFNTDNSRASFQISY